MQKLKKYLRLIHHLFLPGFTNYRIIYNKKNIIEKKKQTNAKIEKISQADPPSLPAGVYRLPPGPLLLSPTNFITGFITEVSRNQLD